MLGLFLFHQVIENISAEAVFLVGWRMFPPWCIAKRRISAFRVDKVALQNGLGIRLHPS